MAVDYLNLVGSYITGHLVEIAIFGIIGFAIFILYRMIKKVPKNPDYVKIFEEKAIEDEQFNKIDKFAGVRFLYRGHEYLGKIKTYNRQMYSILERPEGEKFKFGEKGKDDLTTEAEMITVTFNKSVIGKVFHGGQKHILRFMESEAKIINKNLVFPSNANFTSLGNEYVSLNSYPLISKVIEDNWNKRLHEASTNAYAQQMLKVAGYLTEFAQERKLKELEIEKIKMEKQLKMGNIV